MAKETESEYNERLRELEAQGELTKEEVEAYKKTALLLKSVDEVKRRAQELHEIRNSPERYKKV
jgi:hypothetical protein